MPKYYIDPEKKYSIPKEISFAYCKDVILAIAPEIACWIVLHSKEHEEILKCFKDGASIGNVISDHKFEIKDITYVVTQIEARRFFQKKVHSSTEDGRNLHFYLTNKCNLSCPHCYMFSGNEKKGELTTSEIFKVLSDYKRIGNGSIVTISGGEPTIRKDFDLIVSKAFDLGLKVKILSNGSFLTRERIAKIHKFINSVQISIDGFSEESNAKVRGVGHFNKALSAIRTLTSFGIETSIAITPPYEILKEHIKDYLSFAQNLAEQYQDKPLRIKFAGEMLSGRLIKPTKTDKASYLSIIESIHKELYGADYDAVLFARQFMHDNLMVNCMFGVFSIASNGDVFFCARTGDLPPIANVRTTSFEEICRKSSAAEYATSVIFLKPCKDCELRFICGGGCRIDEFPELVNRVSFDNLDYELIPARNCNDTIKQHFYDLMIRGNKYLYSPLLTV